MKKLWAPWRIEYILAPREAHEACIFCAKPAEESDRDNLVLYRGKRAFIIMNLYPYNNAHLLVVPYSHVNSISALTREERCEMMEMANAAMDILKGKMNAQGFNFGANIGAAAGAGIEEHVHLHIVPRWTGDTNFMPVLGHTKVLVQGLQETYDTLKPLFDQLSIT